MPIVSWMSSCWAITSLVPTPSVDEARIGLLYFCVFSRNRPEKPPRSPITSGRGVFFTLDLSSSTARSPAWIDTPASAYVTVRLRAPRPAPAVHGWRSAPSAPLDPALLRSDTCVTVLPLQLSSSRSRVVEGRGAARAGDQRSAHRPFLLAVLAKVVVGFQLGHRGTRRPGRHRRALAHALEQVLADQVAGRQLDRILPIETGHAETSPRLLGRLHQTVQRNITQAVGSDRAPDAVDLETIGDQLGPGGEVDAVEARPLHRRRRDPDVHLEGAGLAQHPDLRTLGVAAHDRVVDHHDPLAADHLAQRVQLQPDAQLADRLGRLDEGTSDVGV